MPTFIERSQPEAEEREHACNPDQGRNRVLDLPPVAAKRVQPILKATPEIHAAFLAWREANGRPSNAEIGRMLNYSSAMVSNYANDLFRGDLAGFESRVSDLLRGEAIRREFDCPFLDTSVTNQCANFIDGVRASSGVGVLHGDAGLGKSTGCRSYASGNPTSIYLEADAFRPDATGVKQLLWSVTPATGYRANTSRVDHIFKSFRDSGRVLIVDNAQRLVGNGRHAFYDFHDKTRCPIIFVGNPCIIARIADDDQQFSRTLPQLKVSLRELGPIVDHILRSYLPDVPDSIFRDAIDIAKGKGHLRQLINICKGALAYADLPKFKGDIPRSFNAAVAASIRAPKAA